MPIMRPGSDLRNKYNEIFEFCNTYNEQAFVTKNGMEDKDLECCVICTPGPCFLEI